MKLRRPADGILAAPCNDWDSARPAGSSKECYIRLASRQKRQAAVLLRCMSPDVAHSYPGRMRRNVSSWRKRTCGPQRGVRLMPSRPGEFHPEPLTEPDLTLSRHPARATARRLPPSIEHRVPPVAG